VAKQVAAPKFSSEAVKSIAASLPSPRSPARCELLPGILREWSHNELRRHLSLESRATVRGRIKKLQAIKRQAIQLSRAFEKVDEAGQRSIVAQMLGWPKVRTGNFKDEAKRLHEVREYIRKLATLSPEQCWTSRRGRPRNYAAYLVLQDAAAIFKWFCGKKATRVVNRIDNTETGPFFRFASTLWPIVFGKGHHGLTAAMKNWATGRTQFDEASALIANIDLRHPTWGIFED
jgi:hypothetical protein